MSKYADAVATVGEELVTAANKAKVLVVGSGGIGCELLKNLVLSGFEDIETIDLDTVDVSNLNRQFLFRKKHVGHPKSEVAAEAVRQFNPSAKVLSRTGSILAPEFGVEFFKQFSIVMNALDNVAARRHVNRMCLAADVPLIESGTAGYLGQVTVIRKGVTECYECQPKPAPKQFPVCTIRHTPSTFIHCVVWAKHLFALAFGTSDDLDNVTQLPSASTSAEFATMLFHKVFVQDIEELLTMSDLWKGRAPPTPLNPDNLSDEVASQDHVKIKDQKLWSLRTCGHMFAESGMRLRDRGVPLTFDKDDADALDFVTAAANLRAACFAIPCQSRFDVKAYAGNIIAAIATTNAIIAGLIVTQAFRLLDNRIDQCRTVFCRKYVPGQAVLVPEPLNKPKATCYVCSTQGIVGVKLNCNTTTFGEFVKKVIMGKLNFVAPSITVNSKYADTVLSRTHMASLIYEVGEDVDDMSYQLPKLLKDVGLVGGASVYIDDFLQALRVQMMIAHSEDEMEEGFEVEGETKAAEPSTAAVRSAETPAVDTTEKATGRRKRDESAVDRDAAMVVDDGADAQHAQSVAKKVKGDRNVVDLSD